MNGAAEDGTLKGGEGEGVAGVPLEQLLKVNEDRVGTTSDECSAVELSQRQQQSVDVSQHEEEEETGTPPLSKKQLRKVQRHENSKKKWRLKRLEKREKRKQSKRNRSSSRSPNISANEHEGGCRPPARQRLKQKRMAASSCRLRVAVDMSFDHLMSDKELRSCLQQIGYCYAANRRAHEALQLYLVNLNGKSKQMFDSLEDRKSWDVNVESRSVQQLFAKEEVVYLTSESDNQLETLDESKVYIIGGLVDHNAHKGLCHKLAAEAELCHGRLPIGEHLSDIKGRKVLTINQVFEILLHFTENNDWKTAISAVVPKRKQS